MKISHECPLALLESSRYFNDYDYALVHLFPKYEEYFNFFKESLAQGRDVILDNSLFELGKAFDTSEFIKWIEKLKPTQYIIPDSWGSCTETLEALGEFKRENINHKAVKIGVAQGATRESTETCFKRMYHDPFVDKIAISFGSPAWNFGRFPASEFERLYNQAVGRFEFVDKMVNAGYVDKKVHLLGVSLPQELLFYNKEKYSFVESVDSSNPIVHGMEGVCYSAAGLMSKNNKKIAENMEVACSNGDMRNIFFNIKAFRKMLDK